MDTQDHSHYRADFEAFSKNGASASPAWIKDLRSAAMARFIERGFPTTSEEDWRFTNVSPIARIPFRLPPPAVNSAVDRAALFRFGLRNTDEWRMVFVNGSFSPELSSQRLPDGVRAMSLSAAMTEHPAEIERYLRQPDLTSNVFAALNTAFLREGAFVRVERGSRVSQPLHLLFVSVPGNDEKFVAHPRNLVMVEEGADAVLVESYVSLNGGVYFTNVVSDVVLLQSARLERVKIEHESPTAYHVDTTRMVLEKESVLRDFSLTLGGAIARNTMSVFLNGEGCDCNIDGLYIAKGHQLLDNHTMIDHTQPRCSSHELYKGILYDNAHAVYNGKVLVRPPAQKTDSKQTNRNLLMSDTAVVDTKPQLEIFADDVKCTHGAAVGGLDAESVFYLKSRGISEEAAKVLVTVGFASEATELIGHDDLRRHVDSLVVGELQAIVGEEILPPIVHATV